MRTLYVVVIVGTVLVLIIAISVALGLTLSPTIKSTFMNRCEKLKSNEKCQNIWRAFEKAYVGKDPCNVPMEAYNELISTAPFEYAHNRVMFWSKIKKSLVRNFTKKRRCFVTLEDTLLGSVLDGLKWCGKEGSSETFSFNCRGESDCENNPVRSFWKRASAAFADVASGHVTAMLDGSIPMPFDPTSIFGSIEVVRLRPPRVTSLNVVLVIPNNGGTNCNNDASLRNLRNVLAHGIYYYCKDVTESMIQDCISHPDKPCAAC